MKKQCTSCTAEKDLGEYRKDKLRPDGYQSRCKVCARAAIRSRYDLKRAEATKAVGVRRREAHAILLYNIKLANPCCICGEDEVSCLDFHHLDPFFKEFGISSATHRSVAKVLEEVEKCVILCSNCHRKLHAGRFDLLPTVETIRRLK